MRHGVGDALQATDLIEAPAQFLVGMAQADLTTFYARAEMSVAVRTTAPRPIPLAPQVQKEQAGQVQKLEIGLVTKSDFNFHLVGHHV